MKTQQQAYEDGVLIHLPICRTLAEGQQRGRAARVLLAAIVVAGCVSSTPGCAREETNGLIPRIERMSPADRAPTKHCTFVLRTPLPSAPETLTVYRVRPFVPKKPILLRLIKALAIKATPEVARTIQKIEAMPEPLFGRERPGMSVSVGEWTVEVLRGGAYGCSRDDTRGLSAADVAARKKVKPPSAASVRKVADSFLTRAGLMTEGLQFSRVGATEWMDGTPVCWAAAYRRDIDGIGAGAGLSVCVGPDLKLVSVSSGLRELIVDRIVPIISAQEAFDLLCNGEGHFFGTTVSVGKRCVESVRLTYWQGPRAIDHEYVVPIYVFETDTGDERCSAFVEAIKPEYLEQSQAGSQ